MKKTLDDFFQQSFKKIRVTESKSKVTNVSKLMDTRKELKYRMKQNNEDLEEEIHKVEEHIAKECADENMEKVRDNFKSIADNNDSVSINGMWNIKKKVFPKLTQVIPTGKKNAAGQIITNPEALKQLYLDTYKHRLRHQGRPKRNESTQGYVI